MSVLLTAQQLHRVPERELLELIYNMIEKQSYYILIIYKLREFLSQVYLK